MRLVAIGDSETKGDIGPSVPANGYIAKLVAKYGATLQMLAANGSCAADQALVVAGSTFQATDIITCMLGVNDSQRYFTAAQQAYFRGFITDIVVRSSFPNRVGIRAATKTGTWAPLSQYAWSTGCSCATPGSTATAVVSGVAVYIGTIFQDYNGGPLAGSAEVWIDGVLAGTYSSNGQGCITGMNTFGTAAIRFGGLAAGQHTVMVKLVSGQVYAEYIAGSDQPASPQFFLATPARTYQPGDTGVTAAALGVIVKDVAAKMVADDRHVAVVDINPLILSTDVISDLIHPNDSGNLKEFNAFDAVISAGFGPPPPPPPPPTYTPAQIVIDAAGNYFGQKLDGTGTKQLTQ